MLPPAPGDVRELPEHGSAAERDLAAVGMRALEAGELALVVLAGGMATRMGGVVKALIEAVDGHTFLELRLAERDHWSRVAGSSLPLWMLTSHATDEPIRTELGSRLDGITVDAVRQNVSLRLTPEKTLFMEADGRPSPPRDRSRRPGGRHPCPRSAPAVRRCRWPLSVDRQPGQSRCRTSIRRCWAGTSASLPR